MTTENRNSALNDDCVEDDIIETINPDEDSVESNDNVIEDAEFIDLPEEYRDVAHQLVEDNPNVFQGMNLSQKIEVIKTFEITSFKAMSHSGPLPDPESLARYNEIITDGANRIMKMAENQQAHRMHCDKTIIKGNNNQITRGQWFGFLLALFFMTAGLYLAVNGFEACAIVIFSTTIVGLVGVFVVGRIKSSKNIK